MRSFRIFPCRKASIIVVSASPQRKVLGTMGDLQLMSASMDSDPDIALFREDLVILKRDVASLIEHIKGGATNNVQNATNQIERQCGASAKKRGRKVNARPRRSESSLRSSPLSR